MPSRVHALLVVRPDGHLPADLHLKRTLTALREQSRPVDELTIVMCGKDAATAAVAADAAQSIDGAQIVTTEARTSYARALALAAGRVEADAVWLLAQDTAPAPDALARLAGALETAPSVAIAAPKLVRWEDSTRIVSLGETVTVLGRSVPLAEGEFDQGQHDAREDVLGADVRGLLVRAGTWRELAGIDTGLSGADEGLDLGIRVRLRGDRVALAPGALVAVAGDGVAGVPSNSGAWLRRAYATRAAQLHRRLVYAPAAVVVLHWLSLLPLALVRSIGHVLAKEPGRIGPEWAAAAVAAVRPVSVARARARIRRSRTAPWSQLAPLRITRSQLRHRFDGHPAAAVGPGRGDLHFFGGGGAWLVLAALVVSVVSFTALLAWPVLGGGALAPLRTTVVQLWADASSPVRSLGWATVGPADPFSAVIATIGSLWPPAPSRALVVLWLLALPLAAAGGWFMTTRISDRAIVRAVGGAGWALAPMFLTALVEGRPAGMIVHLLLPWVVLTASVAHRSWSSAGLASVLLVGVLACAPSLAPALALLWVIALGLTIGLRRNVGLARVAWLLIPSLIVFAPLAVHRLRAGEGAALLADPGVPLASGAGSTLIDRLLLIAGLPTADAGGWAVLSDTATVWVPLLVVPLLVLALLAPLTARPLPAAILLTAAVAGLLTAAVTAGIAVSSDGIAPIGLWPGAGLSLYWAGLLGAALATLDGWHALSAARIPVAAALIVLLGVTAAPALTAGIRGTSALAEASPSTLPAYVAAEGRGTLSTATFVMTPTADGSVIVDVVWGDTSALGGQTTLRSARSSADDGDRRAAQLAAALIAEERGDAVARLAEHGIAYIMLATDPQQPDQARGVGIQAETSLNQRPDLEKVGETSKGMLWRIATPVTDRTLTAGQHAQADWTAVLHTAAIAVSLLLALPTRRSRAASRRWPRVVGIGGGS